jgi:hypothetical protein
MNVNSIQDFTQYVQREILPATAELEKIKDEKSRKHLQKLAYTNIVNRFDSMIDGALLDNCRSPYLIDKATSNLNSPVTESDLIKLLLKGKDVEEALTSRLIDSLRVNVLRERHSLKLKQLFEAFGQSDKVWNHPRVNISTGQIVDKIKPTNRKIPYSICGYCDWLYSRRNALVHGAGQMSFLENDIRQLQKLYKCTPARSLRIRISTIRNTATFYEQVAKQLINSAA